MEHPGINRVFQVSVVTSVVTSYLSVEDLKSCRQVSDDWYRYFSPAWRKRSILVLSTLGDVEKVCGHPDESYEQSPHKQVLLRIKMLEGIKLMRNLDTFWTIHAAGITSLIVSNVYICGVEVLQDILYRKLINLKKLKMECCFVYELSKRMLDILIPIGTVQKNLTELELDRFPAFLDIETKIEFVKKLLLLYPNLTVLRLKACLLSPNIYAQCWYNDLDEIFSDVKALRESNPELYQLKELSYMDVSSDHSVRISSNFLTTLQTCNFPLTTLSLDLGECTPKHVAFQLFQLHKDTLKKLSIFRHAAIPYMDFPFSIQFPELTTLEMSDCVAATLEFAKLMPKLEVLYVSANKRKCDFFKLGMCNIRSQGFIANPNIVEGTEGVRGLEMRSLKKFQFSRGHFTQESTQMLSVWTPQAAVTFGSKDVGR